MECSKQSLGRLPTSLAVSDELWAAFGCKTQKSTGNMVNSTGEMTSIMAHVHCSLSQ
ncbi:hypothetical protein M422DRAFT_251924 [Sphaerobolus stellatus SS14]|uniref:Unplaced genomic scaffold SPHSTscaffold_41, whole genome shotgun sequence n=1 Tax=Sphaerobolus stellatus (strain SS14) TaxID=990650 RepID=A0A0C9W120_SPHS4|nr:hypothetical protein M422DRAFT_251924 [Sphaerobolus stellatus SS14]